MNRATRRRANLAAVMVALLAACSPQPAPSPTVLPVATPNPASTSSASVAPVATSTPQPTSLSAAPLSRAFLAEPGAIVFATVVNGPGSQFELVLEVVRQGHPPEIGWFVLEAPEGWAAGDELSRIRVTADGWMAIEIHTIEDVSPAGAGRAILVVNPYGKGAQSQPIIGGAPVWLPDGTLLFTVQALVDRVYREVARRISDHGFGTIEDLVIDENGARPYFPRRYLVDGQMAGLIGVDLTDPFDERLLTIHWNGTVVRRRAQEAVYLELGSERTGGRLGDRIVGAEERSAPGCMFEGPCASDWRRADGTRLPLPDFASEAAWTRNGAALFVHYSEPRVELDGSTFGLIRATKDGLEIKPLGSRPDAFQVGSTRMGGMSEWAAVLENDASQVVVVPLDGSPALGPFEGTVALVNP